MKMPGICILAMLPMPLLGVVSEKLPTPEASQGRGLTLYVSKLGDDSDGRSWRTAFRTVQAALNAVPNDLGGHRVIIRPDTYAEANLDSKHKGAAGAYNTIEGDWEAALARALADGW
jgi:hypothetical protein